MSCLLAWRSGLLIPAIVATLLFASCQTGRRPAPSATPVRFTGQSHFAIRDEIRLHLWQKCRAGQETAAAATGKVVLLIHGATWSGRPDFDLPIRDYSLMDYLAQYGYDVWAIDIHGYGQSDRSSRDWSDTASAVLDVAAAVEHICLLRQVTEIKMLGWSWGTQIAGVYAAEHPHRVSRLILYGNVWKGRPEWRDIPMPRTQYRPNSEADAREDFLPGWFEPDVVETYAREALRIDPQSPNGVLVDLSTRLPLVDPARILAPTLIIRPERDFASTADEMLSFFARLPNPDKSYLSLPNSGHAAILEKEHRRFQRAVLAFLDNP